MCARARFADQALSDCAHGTRAAFSLKRTGSPRRLLMATALEWYDMMDLDDEGVQKCLPTARHHYDMEELDDPWTPAGSCGDGPVSSSYSWIEVDDAPELDDDEYLQDDMFHVAGDLVFLAQCLVGFFSTSSHFIKTTHMKLFAVFSKSCVVKVEVRRAADQMYVLLFQDLGKSEEMFRDVVRCAVDYLQAWGVCLWEPSP